MSLFDSIYDNRVSEKMSLADVVVEHFARRSNARRFPSVTMIVNIGVMLQNPTGSLYGWQSTDTINNPGWTPLGTSVPLWYALSQDWYLIDASDGEAWYNKLLTNLLLYQKQSEKRNKKES